MNFCAKCGTKFENESKFCTNCGEGAVIEAAQPAQSPQPDESPQPAPSQQPDEPPQPAQEQTPPPQDAAPAKPPSELMTNSINAVKQTFSVDPEAAVETSFESVAPVWMILGGAYVIIYALVIRAWIVGFFESFLNFIGGGFGDFNIRDFIDADVITGLQNQMFLRTLITAAISVFLAAVLVKLICIAFKIDMSFTKSLNLATGASIVPSIILIAALVVTPISVMTAFVLSSISTLAFAFMLYRGMKRVISFPSSPFWIYCALYVIIMVVIMFTSNQLYTGVMEEFFDDLMMRF